MKKRRTKKSTHTTVGDEEAVHEDDEKLRLLDCKTRWMAFLYHFNVFWDTVLRQVYGQDLDMDSYDAITGRAKIFNNVKSYKYEVLKAMEVCVYFIPLSLLKPAVAN